MTVTFSKQYIANDSTNQSMNIESSSSSSTFGPGIEIFSWTHTHTIYVNFRISFLENLIINFHGLDVKVAIDQTLQFAQIALPEMK